MAVLKAPHNERKGQDRTKAGIYIGNHAGNENKEKAPKKSATGGLISAIHNVILHRNQCAIIPRNSIFYDATESQR
jgi:hypothetical protein